jgi:hypothetical protein
VSDTLTTRDGQTLLCFELQCRAKKARRGSGDDRSLISEFGDRGHEVDLRRGDREVRDRNRERED